MGFFKNIFSRNSNAPIPGMEVNYIYPANGELIFKDWGRSHARISTSHISGQAKAYMFCPPVMSVINKKGLAVKNARFWAVDDQMQDVRKPEMYQSMARPNPYQTLSEFICMVEVFANIFGKCYIYEQKSVGFDSRELYVIPNTIVNPIIENHPKTVLHPEAGITRYEVVILNKRMDMAPDEVHVVNDTSEHLYTMFDSVSRLTALEEQINTYMASYEATTELMVNRGALGIISLSHKDVSPIAANNIPQTKEEKDLLQEELSKYGTLRSQFKYILTNAAAAFIPLSSTIGDLHAGENQKNAQKVISDLYGVPSVLLDVEGSTYSNMSEAKKILYTDTIIPEASNIMEVINKIYGYQTDKVMPFYDHLECFQESKRQNAAGFTQLVNGLNQAVSTGLLSTAEARVELDKYRI